MSTFDDLLRRLGTGKWNLTVFLSVCYWLLLLPSHSVGPAFLTPEVGHTCRLPEKVADEETITNMTGSQCSYTVTTTDGSTDERPCTEWDFDNTTYTKTITSEFKLVCSRSFLRPTFKSITFFGALVAAPFSGWMSDRYGRKVMLSVGTVSYALLANACTGYRTSTPSWSSASCSGSCPQRQCTQDTRCLEVRRVWVI
nr:solute carrier family 22 member 6-like [Penaeus vannamei]